VLLAIAALVAWIFVWFLVAFRVVRRQDLGVGGKVLWLLVILVIPILGLFAYFLWDAARPRSA
jgi:hypothetical protein